MKARSLTDLCQSAIELREKSQALKDQAKPFDKEADELEAQILERMQSSNRETFKSKGFIAVLKEKAAAVPWAKLFAARCGAAAVEEAKTQAGTKVVLDLTRLSS
jgi:hypothetical protein